MRSEKKFVINVEEFQKCNKLCEIVLIYVKICIIQKCSQILLWPNPVSSCCYKNINCTVLRSFHRYTTRITQQIHSSISLCAQNYLSIKRIHSIIHTHTTLSHAFKQMQSNFIINFAGKIEMYVLRERINKKTHNL